MSNDEEMKPPILFVHGTFGHGALLEPWVGYFEQAGYVCHAPSLPGRLPTDLATLRRLTMTHNLGVLLDIRATLAVPPILIGHSMGGLLAQQLAAATPCAALVCLASAPPGILWAQPRAVAPLVRLLPRILTGRPLRPSPQTLRAIVFNDLPAEEADRLGEQLVPDSGRAFRSMILGTSRVPRDVVRCPVLCVSGGADRNVSARTSRAIATRYRAEHQIHPDRGHWIVAESVRDEVAAPVLRWLQAHGLDGRRPTRAARPADRFSAVESSAQRIEPGTIGAPS